MTKLFGCIRSNITNFLVEKYDADLAKKTIQTTSLASVILSYLSNREKQKLNLLNQRFYSVVFPAITAQVPNFEPKLWDDWLAWGSGKKSIIVKRGLNVKIGRDVGTYYGEWK